MSSTSCALSVTKRVSRLVVTGTVRGGTVGGGVLYKGRRRTPSVIQCNEVTKRKGYKWKLGERVIDF